MSDTHCPLCAQPQLRGSPPWQGLRCLLQRKSERAASVCRASGVTPRASHAVGQTVREQAQGVGAQSGAGLCLQLLRARGMVVMRRSRAGQGGDATEPCWAWG